MSRVYLIVVVIFSSSLYAEDMAAKFAGRISRLNPVAKIMRLKVDFANAKFLGPKDRIEFWNETYPDKKCLGYLEAKSNEYLLIRIPGYKRCVTNVQLTTGTYLHLYSRDLEQNLTVASDLVDILLKKRLALTSMLKNYKQEVESYVEKMEAVNKRYEILRQKMEIEWQKELSGLEEDKTRSYLSYKDAEKKMDELNFKLQKYRISEDNLKTDRWSLDPNLYYKK